VGATGLRGTARTTRRCDGRGKMECMDQLGAALRAWRDRLDPATVGFAQGSPRRVPGLRRAELATLAGISVEYVVRLEQGRVATPSAQVCSALARALHLSDDEHAHLLRMAGHAADPSRVPRMIPGSLYRIVDQLAATPWRFTTPPGSCCTGIRCSRPRSAIPRSAARETGTFWSGSTWVSFPESGRPQPSRRRSRSPSSPTCARRRAGTPTIPTSRR
jgi:transcriptional regulator with XRE-family HTH domain